jgi:hypothetical protein
VVMATEGTGGVLLAGGELGRSSECCGTRPRSSSSPWEVSGVAVWS